MTPLLVVVSVLAATVLLSVLMVGLLLILKPLQGVRGSLEQIATGVRAIESHARALSDDVRSLGEGMEDMAEAAARAARRLEPPGALAAPPKG